jgi:hypothetical protein
MLIDMEDSSFFNSIKSEIKKIHELEDTLILNTRNDLQNIFNQIRLELKKYNFNKQKVREIINHYEDDLRAVIKNSIRKTTTIFCQWNRNKFNHKNKKPVYNVKSIKSEYNDEFIGYVDFFTNQQLDFIVNTSTTDYINIINRNEAHIQETIFNLQSKLDKLKENPVANKDKINELQRRLDELIIQDLFTRNTDKSLQINDKTRSDLRGEFLVTSASNTIRQKEVEQMSKNKSFFFSNPDESFIDGTVVGGIVAVGLLTGKAINETINKTWQAIIDIKTRDSHRIANQQTVGVNDYFIVGGEYAKHPMDENLSIENKINCRCKVIFEFF